jgi:gamma-glutamylcysteine synthetase
MQNHKRKIGVELEYLIVDAEGLAVKYPQMVQLWRELARFGWTIKKDYYTKKLIAVHKGQDVIGTDYGVCLLELSLSPFQNLHQLKDKVNHCLSLVRQAAQKKSLLVLAYGIQPKSKLSAEYLSPKAYCNLVTKNFLRVKKHRNNCLKWNTAIAANQVNIDLGISEATDALNVFNALSGLFIALCANSPIYQSKRGKHHEQRSFFIDQIPEPCFKFRMGLPQAAFKNLVDYFRETLKINPLFIQRDQQIIDLNENQKISFDRYLHGKVWLGETVDGSLIKVNPDIDDLRLAQRFYWPEARLRYGFKKDASLTKFLGVHQNNKNLIRFLENNLEFLYLEVRPCAAAPNGEETAPSALSLGLLCNLEKAKELYQSLSWNEWRAIRKQTIRRSLKVRKIYPLVQQMLEISEDGLRSRRMGEEKYLEPLWRRFRQKQSPAMKVLDVYQKQRMAGLLSYVEWTSAGNYSVFSSSYGILIAL